MSELMTVAQVAEILKVSVDTVTRRFSRVKGVIDLGSPESPKRRRYRVLRIPKTVVEKYLVQKSGQPMTVEVPLKKTQTRKADWQTKAAQDLLALSEQHGDDARKTLEKIARRAKTLTFVHKSQWENMLFIEDEDRTLNTISDQCEAGECDKCPKILHDSNVSAEDIFCVHSCHNIRTVY